MSYSLFLCGLCVVVVLIMSHRIGPKLWKGSQIKHWLVSCEKIESQSMRGCDPVLRNTAASVKNLITAAAIQYGGHFTSSLSQVCFCF